MPPGAGGPLISVAGAVSLWQPRRASHSANVAGHDAFGRDPERTTWLTMPMGGSRCRCPRCSSGRRRRWAFFAHSALREVQTGRCLNAGRAEIAMRKARLLSACQQVDVPQTTTLPAALQVRFAAQTS